MPAGGFVCPTSQEVPSARLQLFVPPEKSGSPFSAPAVFCCVHPKRLIWFVSNLARVRPMRNELSVHSTHAVMSHVGDFV